MDMEQFDDLTRRLGGAGSSRRSVLRAVGDVLLGGTLGGVAARLGLVVGAAAKPKGKKHKAKPKQKRPSQAERNPRGQLQTEGKRKKKRKKKEPPPLPPECRDCNDCQMCKDGACFRDPALEGVRCLGSGANCGYCQGGICTPTDRRPCDDGVCPRYRECCPGQHRCNDGTCLPDSQCCEGEHKCPNDGPCVAQDQCCPGEKRCPDRESPTGWACVDPANCCPEEKRCGDRCIHRLVCCEADRPQCGPCQEAVCKPSGNWICWGKDCGGGVCVGEDECCPDQWQCADGSCVAQDECCPNERECPDGACVSEGACCPGEKRCADGECIPNYQCCPNEDPPVCPECQVAVCQSGSWSCQPQSGRTRCGANCCLPGEGCVPEYVGEVYTPRCCPLEKIVGGQCCDGQKTICGPPDNQRCCPAGSRCYQDLNGMWLCCAGELCGQHRCCVGNKQCHNGCGTPDGNACCIGSSGCGCCITC